jgi:hypothetical protein
MDKPPIGFDCWVSFVEFNEQPRLAAGEGGQRKFPVFEMFRGQLT